MDCKTIGINAPIPLSTERRKREERAKMQNCCACNHLRADSEGRNGSDL